MQTKTYGNFVDDVDILAEETVNKTYNITIYDLPRFNKFKLFQFRKYWNAFSKNNRNYKIHVQGCVEGLLKECGLEEWKVKNNK